MTDPRLTAVHTKVSGLSALYFPQLQDAICMTNSPGWLTMVIAMFRKILPKKNLEKIVVYSGVTSLWKSEWGKKMLRKEGLPSSCGGTLPDSEVPESFFGKFGGCEDDSPCQTTLTVGSGKVETVEIQIPNPTPMTEPEFLRIDDMIGEIHWGYIGEANRPSLAVAHATHHRMCQFKNFVDLALECCMYADRPNLPAPTARGLCNANPAWLTQLN